MEYVAHQCDHCQCDLRRPYADTIIRISKYLIAIKGIGSIHKTTGDISRDECYADAEFAESNTNENCEDPNPVQ